ncbi:MAG: hypothetical protein M0R77_08700 [Gammaproteobacteria bacterium]|jgi:hypothetical protein|nr:hypothetical protein [Gammaproteobacteria bacterium]
MKHSFRITLFAVVSGLLSACSSGGGDSGATGATVNITGTVPGTRIEAFADNGAYYVTDSVDNGTAAHPFTLAVPARMGLRLLMTTNPGTADEVVTPLGWRGNDSALHTRLLLGGCAQVDLGHVPIPVGPNAAASLDADGDGVLDAPFVLDDQGARNPLTQCDADGDGMNDWDDPDHGGSHYAAGLTDPMDHDGDGIPNRHDPDFAPTGGDSDGDGLLDNFDANPDNVPGGNRRLPDDFNGDGYMDDDMNHDGVHDSGQPQHGGSPMM